MEREIHGHRVRGVEVGPETRCAHYDTDRDVVALRFACCEAYYPCFRCHDASADHEAERLSVESEAAAVLCGVCGAELTPREFVDGEHRCPDCGAEFNPGCADHYERYFAFEG
ncbi:CHY zinc finger protein [Halorussus aquaticus]|uniref:CHY zinc finger protein n=1 Tax=Halorussus aquaticus TaxID=2953748 RepID=A0ABD5Q1L8_9EURY|nr:CHY zinc finger protein [Halorussus aquaticus]